jgi:hypothetical protein
MSGAKVCRIAKDAFHLSETYEFLGIDGPALAVVRHALFKDVPCLILSMVTIVECSAEWPRDFIAHRIGRIPVRNMDRHGGVTDGQGAVFEVHVAAPSEHDAPCRITVVTSKDFVLRRGRDLASAEATLVHACSPAEAALTGDRGLQVVCLLPGQKIRALATASRGTGRESPRWTCVHVAQLEYEPRRILRVRPLGSVTAARALVSALRATRARLQAVLEATG